MLGTAAVSLRSAGAEGEVEVEVEEMVEEGNAGLRLLRGRDGKGWVVVGEAVKKGGGSGAREGGRMGRGVRIRVRRPWWDVTIDGNGADQGQIWGVAAVWEVIE